MSDISQIALNGVTYDIKDDKARREKVAASGGDISNTKITTADSNTAEFPVPAAGDTAKGFLGKMKKFCSDFNSFKDGIITLGKLANNGLTTEEGYALDARMGKTLMDLYSQLNSNLEDKGQLSLVDVLKNRTNLPDLDNIKSVGCYYYAGSTGILHRPFDADGSMFFLITFGSGTDWRLCQLAVETGGKIANRSYIGNRWTNWVYSSVNTDIIVKEFRKTGISVTANTITGINMGDVIQVPSGYRLAAVTPTLSGNRATGMLVSCNQRNYTFFPIYSIAESSDIILDVNCIFIRQ